MIKLALEGAVHLAERLADVVQPGDVIALYGEIGAGKTTFSQHFIRPLLAVSQEVTSPTFNIVQWYDGNRGFRICHADLYRLKQESELLELGLEEAFERDVTLIEWPEIAKNYLPEQALHILITMQQDDTRQFEFSTASSHWHERLQGVLV